MQIYMGHSPSTSCAEAARTFILSGERRSRTKRRILQTGCTRPVPGDARSSSQDPFVSLRAGPSLPFARSGSLLRNWALGALVGHPGPSAFQGKKAAKTPSAKFLPYTRPPAASGAPEKVAPASSRCRCRGVTTPAGCRCHFLATRRRPRPPMLRMAFWPAPLAADVPAHSPLPLSPIPLPCGILSVADGTHLTEAILRHVSDARNPKPETRNPIRVVPPRPGDAPLPVDEEPLRVRRAHLRPAGDEPGRRPGERGRLLHLLPALVQRLPDQRHC